MTQAKGWVGPRTCRRSAAPTHLGAVVPPQVGVVSHAKHTQATLFDALVAKNSSPHSAVSERCFQIGTGCSSLTAYR